MTGWEWILNDDLWYQISGLGTTEYEQKGRQKELEQTPTCKQVRFGFLSDNFDIHALNKFFHKIYDVKK